MDHWLITIATVYPHLVYLLTIVVACAEGPILSILFGVFLHAGYFNFFLVYAALMIGDLLGDCIWYWVGRRYGYGFIRRFGRHFSISEEGVKKATDIFHRHKDWILLISKVTNGFGFALVTLMTAGMMRIPFGRYITINLFGQFVWSGLLIALGYFFSAFFWYMDAILGRLGAVGAGIVIVGIVYIAYKSAREKVIKKV